MGKKQKGSMFDNFTPEQREIWILHDEMKDINRRLEIVGRSLEDPKIAASASKKVSIADEEPADTEGVGKINWYFVFFVAGLGIASYHMFFQK
jgi:hypothetical protein